MWNWYEIIFLAGLVLLQTSRSYSPGWKSVYEMDNNCEFKASNYLASTSRHWTSVMSTSTSLKIWLTRRVSSKECEGPSFGSDLMNFHPCYFILLVHDVCWRSTKKCFTFIEMLSVPEISGDFFKLISYVIQKFVCLTNIKILQVHWSHLC